MKLSDLKAGDEVAVIGRDGKLVKIAKVAYSGRDGSFVARTNPSSVGYNFLSDGTGYGRVGAGHRAVPALPEHRQELAQRETERKAHADAKPERQRQWLHDRAKEISMAWQHGPVGDVSEAIELLRNACEKWGHVE